MKSSAKKEKLTSVIRHMVLNALMVSESISKKAIHAKEQDKELEEIFAMALTFLSVTWEVLPQEIKETIHSETKVFDLIKSLAKNKAANEQNYAEPGKCKCPWC